MESKIIIIGDEGKRKLSSGVDQLSNAVKQTLGPKGRNVVIARKFGNPVVTKDGVSVAKEIFLKDPIENIGAQMVKEVATKTSDMAGDGTTTATLLAQAIYSQGIKNITAGANPMDLKRGMDKAKNVVIEELGKMTKKISANDPKEISQIASISSNGDKEIGDLISGAISKIGKDGVITLEESKNFDTTINVVEGMEFDRGYLSPYFVNDKAKMEVSFEDCYILMYDKKISVMKDIMKIADACAKDQKPLMIIAEDIDGEALATLVYNRIQNNFSFVCVKAPGFGDRRQDMLEDIAIMTGGTVVSSSKGMHLDKVTEKVLGFAKRVIVTRENTILAEGKGEADDISKRIEEIKLHIENTTSDYDKGKLQERLAKLTSGVAVLKIGAPTEIEMKEKKDRVEDALHATRAALQEGIVPGGGEALIRAGKFLDNVKGENDDQNTGIRIIKNILDAPLRQIIKNSGNSRGDAIVDKVREGKLGYNAQNDKFEDLIESGIIDPVKVTRIALENAVSVASMLLITEVVICDEPEYNKDKITQAPQGAYGLQ